jgi:hypothetical protein
MPYSYNHAYGPDGHATMMPFGVSPFAMSPFTPGFGMMPPPFGFHSLPPSAQEFMHRQFQEYQQKSFPGFSAPFSQRAPEPEPQQAEAAQDCNGHTDQSVPVEPVDPGIGEQTAPLSQETTSGERDNDCLFC